jgi:hypothetical protein
MSPGTGPLISTTPGSTTSTNWAGYAAQGGPFQTVSASWVEPAATCTAKNSHSVFWVGLDGAGSSTVEQTGTEADCSGGAPSYRVWYEMYPKAPAFFAGAVSPGDAISASVSAPATTPATGSFTLVLTDHTAGWTKTVTATSAKAALYSAEVIAEAPSTVAAVLPLTNFGTVSFTGATVDGSPIGSFNPQQIVMASGTVVKARPSALKAGQSFTVTWHHR